MCLCFIVSIRVDTVDVEKSPLLFPFMVRSCVFVTIERIQIKLVKQTNKPKHEAKQEKYSEKLKKKNWMYKEEEKVIGEWETS